LLLSDSSVAIHVTNEQVISEKSKFVLIAQHYVKEVKNDLAIHFISSKGCMADMLTKNVTTSVFGHIVPIYTGATVQPFTYQIPN
jgi:hypothetical protein